MAQLVQLLTSITAQLEALEQQTLQPTPPTLTLKNYLGLDAAPAYSKKLLKRRLPNPDRFDGSRSNYLGWKYECEGKLEYDAYLFPTEDAKKRYVLS